MCLAMRELQLEGFASPMSENSSPNLLISVALQIEVFEFSPDGNCKIWTDNWEIPI
jgi:hypothetical protein